MKRKYLLAATLAAALWSAAAMALPSTADVQSAVKAGDYPRAESMMQEVVAAKPQSAKAHYIYAEILAHDAKFGEAAVQARKARALDPAITFTDPDKFRAFERTLNREQAAPGTAVAAPAQMRQAPVSMPLPEQAASSGTPGWVWGLGFAAIAFLIWRLVSARTATMAPAGAGGYAMQPGSPQPGYAPGYGGGGGYAPPGYGQAPGGGLLRTGLAAAGGVAAGMLVEKMIQGNHQNDFTGNGLQGGMLDNGSSEAASELENRPIDFGSGNDWDSGGGSDNFSPSGGGDDGGW